MYSDLKKIVCDANIELHAHGLAPFTWGNVSQVDREKGVFAIKPSGVPYSDLTPEKIVIVSSLRLDVLISGVYDISRSKSSNLIDGEKVFINGKLAKSNSVNIENGSMISVRGYGRFRYTEILGTTRKDRIRILCEIY